MYKLTMCKGLSYHGIVTATVKRPDVCVEKKEDAEYLAGTGYFRLTAHPVPQPTAQPIVPEPEPEKDKVRNRKALENYSKAELEAYAAEVGADISECTNNEQRAAVIKAVLASKENRISEEESLEPAFTLGA